LYIQKIILQGILDLLRKRVDKDLVSLLEKINPEIWATRLTDDKEDLIRPFNVWWWGNFAQSARDCTQRIKEILAAKSGRELKPLTSIKMSLSKQELLEIAKILKIRIPKGANQWDVSGKITAEIIKDQKKFIKTITKSAQKSPFLLK